MRPRQLRVPPTVLALTVFAGCGGEAAAPAQRLTPAERLAAVSAGVLPRVTEAGILADSLSAHLRVVGSSDSLNAAFDRYSRPDTTATRRDTSTSRIWPKSYFGELFRAERTVPRQYVYDSAAAHLAPFNLCYPTAHLKIIADSLPTLPRSQDVDGPLTQYTGMLTRVAFAADTLLERAGNCYAHLTRSGSGWVWTITPARRLASLPPAPARQDATLRRRLTLMLDSVLGLQRRVTSTIQQVSR